MLARRAAMSPRHFTRVFTDEIGEAPGAYVERVRIEAARRGAGEILLTSMDADGTKAGYDLELTARISESLEIPVIASGGAGNIDHMVDVLREGKADAVLAASIFHFGEYTVGDVKDYLAERGIPVRPHVEVSLS